jgi:hypothetical protein
MLINKMMSYYINNKKKMVFWILCKCLFEIFKQNIYFLKLPFLSNQKECKKSSELVSNFLYKRNMFCLKQVCVHWVNLMKKKIMSKFQRL